MPQYQYKIKFDNIGKNSNGYVALTLRFKLDQHTGQGTPDDFTVSREGTQIGYYEPKEGYNYVEFKVKATDSNNINMARLVSPLISNKDDCVLITDKGNGQFRMRIYLVEIGDDETNVEVGVEEPPTE